jgi:ethanolaminephosphotransferase
VPVNIAPNLITFVGFLLTVFNYILISFYDYYFRVANDPDDNAQIPQWVFIVAGINVFIAYTLDGIDGKHARRTGTSSPLGECRFIDFGAT